jgi:S-DNA-T family DNA segregation ATPase FtsK/SpoIIIE
MKPASSKSAPLKVQSLKVRRLVASPTPSRRLNEMLGLIVLVAAGLLFAALFTYTPSDPSFNSVGGSPGPHPAQNWAGIVGAYFADLTLQTVGISILLAPWMLFRLGLCWLRSRPFGSPALKLLGLLLWLVAAPTALAMLPGNALFKHTLPLCGLTGRFLADALVHALNLPGAAAVCGLVLTLSLYLTSAFTFDPAEGSFLPTFGLFRSFAERRAARRQRQQESAADRELGALETRRQRADDEAQKRDQQRAEAARPARSNTSLLAGLFGWFGGRKHSDDSDDLSAASAPDKPSVWNSLPRTQEDAAPITLATAAAAPYAVELAAAAAPLRTQRASFTSEAPGLFAEPAAAPIAQDDTWLDAPERHTPPPILPNSPARTRAAAPVALPPMPSPTADIRDQNIAFGKRADADIRAVAITPKSVRGYKLPPSDLLFKSEEHAQVREAELRAEAAVLVQKCAEFGVDGKVEQINPGPVVTTFEFRPDVGVKVSRVVGLADDLCLAMAAESILIERMAGKSTIGIQIPNRERETIWLRDVVECESFVTSKSKLAIALGKDISGRIVTGDLASMPHVLIAGSTGSGKSVAINAMIMSVLFKSTPEQVRMILVDPKRVELGMYEGIPHLFTPIITEAKLAANALRNAVREMERRLKLLAANHVRNIDQFNKLFEHGSDYLFEDVNQEPLPYIMIIIDELADLMMLDRANVEEAITRLAQMARAVGIHLVLATQRPSVDVITGLIKANVPTRMSFRLAGKVDSRTIIDSNGAESLLGRGDMLFLPPGTSRLQRVHAPYVTEKEIAAVTAFWRAQGEVEYAEGFLEAPKDDKAGSGESSNDNPDDNDPMFDDAVRLVFEFGKASTSLLQRRLRIGYGRAAHLIDLMEKDGLVGPADGSKPREILKAPSYYAEVDAALR